MKRSPINLQLLDVSDDHAFLSCGPLACVVWRGAITEDLVKSTEELGLAVLRRSPKGAALLFYAEPTATPPDPELRLLSAEINERLASKGAVGVAGVFSASGFVAAVQRGIATGMSMLSAHSYSFRAFRETKSACRWLDGELRNAGVIEDLVRAGDLVDNFREKFAAHGASVPVATQAI